MDCIDHGRQGNKHGYSMIRVAGVGRKLHAVVLEEASGDLANGRLCLHSCDNPRCINPEHLRWGTHADNMRDKVERGRSGELFDVEHARSMRTSGLTLQQVADVYGVSRQAVHKRLKG